MRTRLRHLLEWLPVLIIAAVVVGIWQCRLDDVPDEEEPYAPLRLLRLEVVGDQLIIGRPGTLLNGICNDSDEPLIAEVYLAAQREATDPLLQGNTFALIEREAGTGQGRGAARPIDPGCLAADPIVSTVPPDFPVGRWRLFLEVTTRGSAGEIQTLTAFSDYFDVIQE